MTGSAYKILGLKPGASEIEIRRRYRMLVKKFHPDVNQAKDAKQKFQEIQSAYELLLNELKHPKLEKEKITEVKTAYEAYRETARQKYAARKKKEAENYQAHYQGLREGKTIRWHQLIAYTGIILATVLALDNFLPTRTLSTVVSSYSTEVYQSMNGDRVSLIRTQSGESLFLNAFSNVYFDTNPFIKIEKTAIFHQSINVISNSFDSQQKIPIHFNFYWAQFVLYPFFLFPFIFLQMKNKDLFVFGSYVSRYICGIIMLYFLITEERWYHLITLGFY